MTPRRISLFPYCATPAIALLLLQFVPFSECQEPTPPPASSGARTMPRSGGSLDATPAPTEAFQTGLKEFRTRQFQAAETSFALAADTQTDALLKSHAYAWLARTELHLYNVTAAQQAAEKAVDTARDSSNAQTAMAEVYFRQAKMAEAQQILIPLVKSQTAGARTYLALAKIYRAVGNYKSAQSLIEIGHRMDPKDPDLETLWLSAQTRDERLRDLKSKLEGNPGETAEEQENLAQRIKLLEDLGANPNRTCRLVSRLTKTEVTLSPLLYDPYHIRGYGLGVRVNNTPAILLLDTGASGFLVSSRIAEKAGLRKIGSTPVAGIGDEGASKGYLAFAGKIKIGELEFENCYVKVVDKKRPLKEDGLLGADVFEDYLVDLNFPDAKLGLTQLPAYPDELHAQTTLNSEPSTVNHLHNSWTPPEFADFDKVYRFGHMLLLPVGLNKAPAHLFLLDTGAFDNQVAPSAALEASKISQDYDIKVSGLSGEVKKVFTTGNLLLTFGHFQQRGDLIGFDMTSLSNSTGTEISGILGFAMLELLDIKIDYRDHLVKFSFDSTRIH